eukprot:sb/3465152/
MPRGRGSWGNHGNRRGGNTAYDRGDPRRGEPEVLYSPELCLALPKLSKKAEEEYPEPQQARTIDGSVLEGGGQILRISAALSCLTSTPVTVHKVRGCRPKPGLSAQHLAGLRLVAAICTGQLTGGEIRSEEISLSPHQIRAGKYTVDVKTAGSVALLLQTSLPCLLFASEASTLVLKGGTNADFAPPIDYFTRVFSHYAALFGVRYETEVVRRGFNPRGGGEVEVKIHPLTHLQPVTLLERGDPVSATVSVLGGTGKRCLHPAVSLLSRRFGDLKISTEVLEEGCQEGWGITILLKTNKGCLLAASSVGANKRSPERLATDTTERLIKDYEEGGCCDCYMQDQVIILAALARGTSRIRTGPLTLHTKTAIHVCEALTGARFSVTKEENGNLGEQSYVIECEGVGHTNMFDIE